MNVRMVLVLCAMMAFAAPALSADPCDILEKGNAFYSAGKYEEAIAAFSEVEKVDRVGKAECTDSIYATVATSYAFLAQNALPADTAAAANFYRLAAKYNRAFAAALMCRSGNCRDSQDIWSGNSIW